MNQVQLINDLGEELRMGAQQSMALKTTTTTTAKPPRQQQSRYLKVLPIRTCGHCVDCCCPAPPPGENNLVSLAYMKTFVHHSLPNTPANMAIPRKYLLSSSLMNNNSSNSKPPRHDYVDSNPSSLRRRRQLPLLPFVDLPHTYTNVPDFYSELLVIQYEIKREVSSPEVSSSSTNKQRIDAGNVGKEYASSFICKEVAPPSSLQKKRSYKEIMRESCLFERQDSVISSSSALSSEFSFDGFDDNNNVNARVAECRAEALTHIGRFKVQYHQEQLGVKRKIFQSFFERVSNGRTIRP
jgi:hypothetical protein